MVDVDSHILEKTFGCEFFDGIADVVSRDGDLPALEQAGLTDNLIRGEICVPLDAHISYDIFSWTGVVHLNLRESQACAQRKQNNG